MSGGGSIGKVFKKVAKVVTKAAPVILAAAAIVFTAGAALGALPTLGAGMTSVFGTSTLGSVMAGAVTQAAYGSLIGGALAGVTGGNVMKGMQMGTISGAVTGGITGGLNVGAPDFAAKIDPIGNWAEGSLVSSAPTSGAEGSIIAENATQAAAPGMGDATAVAGGDGGAITGGAGADAITEAGLNNYGPAINGADAAAGVAATPQPAGFVAPSAANGYSAGYAGGDAAFMSRANYMASTPVASGVNSGGGLLSNVGGFASRNSEMIGRIGGGAAEGVMRGMAAGDSAEARKEAAQIEAQSNMDLLAAKQAQISGNYANVSGGGLLTQQAVDQQRQSTAQMPTPSQRFDPNSYRGQWVYNAQQGRIVFVPNALPA